MFHECCHSALTVKVLCGEFARIMDCSTAGVIWTGELERVCGCAGKPITLRAALARYADLLSPVSKPSLQALSAFAEGEDQARLRRLLSPEGALEYKAWHQQSRSLLEVLEEFSTCRPPLGELHALRRAWRGLTYTADDWGEICAFSPTSGLWGKGHPCLFFLLVYFAWGQVSFFLLTAECAARGGMRSRGC